MVLIKIKDWCRHLAVSLVLVMMLGALFGLFASSPVKAATATIDNPVIFDVKGGAGGSTGIQYSVVVEGVFNQSYQSFSVTYPAELQIPSSILNNLRNTWTVSEPTSGGIKSANFILKTGQTIPGAAGLKNDIEKIKFDLVNGDVFPLEGSTVSITASAAKVTLFLDDSGYVHYYEFVPFNPNSSGVPQAGSSGANEPYLNWWKAYNAAKSATRQDPRFPDNPTKKLHGYLATVTSETEQKQIYSAIADWSGWLGGTRMILSSGSKKIQDDSSIPVNSGTSSTGYTFGTAQNRWYWAGGPEAWTVYNSVTGKYVYYPQGMTSVPNDSWVVDLGGGNYSYAGHGASPPAVGGTVIHDPNRGQPVVPLEFYKNHVYAASPDYRILGVYSNWNNPVGGMLHYYNNDKVYYGKTEPGSGAEPNGTTSEYVLQFAYPSSGTTQLTAANNRETPGNYTVPTYPVAYPSKPDTWNDYAATNMASLYGYFIEYGGYPSPDPSDPDLGDPLGSQLAGSEISTTSEIELVQPIVIQYRSTIQNADETHRKITSVDTSSDRVITYEVHLPYTAYRETENNPYDKFSTPPGYTAYGYQFIGTTADELALTVNSAGDVSGFHSTSMQRIIFLYRPDQYVVTFDANFVGWNQTNVSPSTKNVYYDSPFGTLGTATRPGYTFAGWFTDPSGGTQITEESLMTLGNITLYAHWAEKNSYMVKYNLDGGTASPAIVDKTGVAWTGNNLLPANSPTKEHYTFTGWDVIEGGNKQGVTNSDKFSDLANSDIEQYITLKAQWKKDDEILVIYHLNGAESPGAIPNQLVWASDEVVGQPVAVRSGYTFDGWKVSNKGDGTAGSGVIVEHSTYQDLAAPSATFIILQAQWTAKNYTVSYHLNGGTSTAIPNKTGVGWSQNGLLPTTEPTWAGHIFMGWNTNIGGSSSGGITAYAGSPYSQLVENDSTNSVTLYAQWAAASTYQVRYDTNGGSPTTITNKIVYLDDFSLLPASNPTPPTGYNFAAWSVSDNGTKTGVTNSDKFSDLAADPNAGYITLQAQYSPKSNLTVVYNLNGGTSTAIPNKTGVVWTQTHLLPLVDPTRTGGYTFTGWNNVQAGTGTYITQADNFGVLVNNVDSQTTANLYAQWAAANTYTVRYNLNGGSQPTTPISNVTLNAVSDVVPAPTPKPPPGYTFVNWTVEDNGYGQGTPNSPNGTTTPYSALCYGGSGPTPASYILLKANYAEISSYIVNYDWNYDGAPSPTSEPGIAWTDSKFVPHTASRPGHNLLGWTTDPGGTKMYVKSTDKYLDLVGGNGALTSVTLYAQWEEAHFYVNYDLNGISAPAGNTNYNQRTVGFDDTNLVPLSLQRVGYTPAGWNVSVNGFKIGVTSADSYRSLANTGAPYITLQQQWAAKEYVVYYDINGGTPSGPFTPQTATGEIHWWSDTLIPTVSFTRPGYQFLGWKLSKRENTAIPPAEIAAAPLLGQASKYSELAEVSGYDNGNITLQIQWQENPSVAISYAPKTENSTTDNLGGTVSPSMQMVLPASGVALSVATPKPGYHLVGWFDAADTEYVTNLSLLNNFEPPKASDGTNKAGSYVALFKENPNITISYTAATDPPHSGGGSVSVPSQTIGPASGVASVIATPTAGYYLVGWYESTDTTYTNRLSTSTTFSPPKNSSGLNVAGSYVARFALIVEQYGIRPFLWIHP